MACLLYSFTLLEFVLELMLPVALLLSLLGGSNRSLFRNILLVHFGVQVAAARVVARSLAAIGNPEATVESRQSPGEDDNEFNDVVEAVVASLVMEPRRVIGRTLLIGDSGTEASSESQ